MDAGLCQIKATPQQQGPHVCLHLGLGPRRIPVRKPADESYELRTIHRLPGWPRAAAAVALPPGRHLR
ncbi:MAG TPA: hypothetical protein VKY90_02165, partial [Candidatus Dormibacteraeota bacterium]|nr:hypothetical protein [Candidatus Dormibacteraeota bacterium]